MLALATLVTLSDAGLEAYPEHTKIVFSQEIDANIPTRVEWLTPHKQLQLDITTTTDLSKIGVWGPPGDNYILFKVVSEYMTDTNTISSTTEEIVFSILARPPPQPTPPTPPTPEPTPPTPPEPTPPTPDDIPFTSPGLAVMIIREASPEEALPFSQQAVFTDPVVIAFAQNCVQVPGGDDRFFRIWDDDYTENRLRYVPDALKQAYFSVKDKATTLPYIAIVGSDGKSGFAGPLPQSVTETLELLNEYK